jgi:hypothetical protein
MNTLLLDQAAWDLVLDVNGDIAVASNPYSLAQDVASAAMTFLAECWYDTSLGMPYFQTILGELPPLNYVKQQIVNQGMKTPEVKTLDVVMGTFTKRNLSGQIHITDIFNQTSSAGFGL